jgi:hypothetical protein
MNNKNHDRDIPMDEFDRWLQVQKPPEASSTFLDRCLATIPQVGVVKAEDELTISPVSQESKVMAPIPHEQAIVLRRQRMKKRIRIFGISGTLVTIVALFFIGSLWPTQSAEAQKAAAVLARGAEAVPNPTTVHIVAKTRRYFPAIFPDADFVRAEIWREFGDKPKWRVEQPDKVVVMDGVSTVGFFPTHLEAIKFPQVTFGALDTEPLLDLTDVQDMLTNELRFALAKGWDLKLTHETTSTGEMKLLVSVEAKAGLPEGDYLKNTFFYDSDMRHVYRFDAKTQRLEGFEAYLHQPGGDILMMAIERIEYDQPIDPAVFSLKLPENVYWITDPEPLPDNEKYEKMTPKDTAQAFFEACAKEDWDETMKFRISPWSKGSKEYYGRLKIVHIGEPFQSARDVGSDVDWFVPYEIKLNNGEVLKHNLALRKYKSARRYIVDGGI